MYFLVTNYETAALLAGLVGGNQLWPGGKKVRRQKGRCSDGGRKRYKHGTHASIHIAQGTAINANASPMIHHTLRAALNMLLCISAYVMQTKWAVDEGHVEM